METHPSELNILGFFSAPRNHYRPRLFSSNEIFCGPDAEDGSHDGRILQLRTPAGGHDVAETLAQLPTCQWPHLAVVRADAWGRNRPRNLSALPCPKVLVVGDSHQGRSPLSEQVAYALAEPFDYLVVDGTLQHAHWFARAGIRNVHWLPGLFANPVHRPRRSSHAHPLTFVGRTGNSHPWRRSVLLHLRDRGLPLEVLEGTPKEAADCYSDSLVTLNVSLNGEINSRIFEALASGGFLVTDGLCESSGLSRLFESGRHLQTWDSLGELESKLRYYLDHPDETVPIRAAGQAEVECCHGADVKAREFIDLVLNARVNPRYEISFSYGSAHPFPSSRVGTERIQHMAAYEWVQEVHRRSASVQVYVGPSLETSGMILSDMKRVSLVPHSALQPTGPADPASPTAPASSVLWIGSASESLTDLMGRFTGDRVIAPVMLAPRLAEWGFQNIARSDDGMGLFALSQPVQFLSRALKAGATRTVALCLPQVLSRCSQAGDCLELARCARAIGAQDLTISALQRSVALDRTCQAALVELGALALQQHDNAFAALALEEARRCGPLPEATDRIRLHLSDGSQEALRPYLGLTGRIGPERTDATRRILVVTNLFPPQELGGYGRMIWEFARGLRARGHAVRVLAADVPALSKRPADDEVEMEGRVSRSLGLWGSWSSGKVAVADAATRVAVGRSNASRVLHEASVFEPDLVLLGNLDFLGSELVHEAIAAGYPVLHAVANEQPGYPPSEQPRSPSYWMAPCSDWNGRALAQAGYRPGRMVTLYPGARIDRFYRAFPPDLHTLRIAYASIVAPYKGASVLVEALARLRAMGIEFTAEIAGEALDASYLDRLKQYCLQSGLAGRVTFTGYLDRQGIAALYARSNVLVFPSQFPEPFGISQVEAMASGLVVVSSGTGGAAEVVSDERDGLLYRPDDPAALAARLHTLADDAALFRRLQMTGQRRALRFSVDAAVREIEAHAAGLIAAGESTPAVVASEGVPQPVS